MIILYAYDANLFLVELIKSRSDSEILRASDLFYYTFETAGHAPKLNIMDNGQATLNLADRQEIPSHNFT